MSWLLCFFLCFSSSFSVITAEEEAGSEEVPEIQEIAEEEQQIEETIEEEQQEMEEEQENTENTEEVLPEETPDSSEEQELEDSAEKENPEEQKEPEKTEEISAEDTEETEKEESEVFETDANGFEYSVNNGEVTITGYSGPNTEVTIPSKINNNPVKSIGYEAFYNCNSITSITIPNSVTTIGNNAFKNCTSLTKITIPSSVTNMGINALSECSYIEKAGPIGSNSNYEFGWTKTIPAFAFYGSAITSIVFPNGVTSIGQAAFSNCRNLTSITIPNGVTSLGDSVFNNCSNLSKLIVPSTVTSMGGSSFYGCSSIKTAGPIGSNSDYEFGWTNTIPANAFFGSNITSVTIPNTVTSIGRAAFYYCDKLTDIILPNGLTSIEDSTFGYCKKLTSMNIPTSVTSIGSEVFQSCYGLTSVTVPESVGTIGQNAFRYCSEIKTAGPIGSDSNYEFGWTKTIPDHAFMGCSNLTVITIPDSITTIGDYAFSYCSRLQNLTLPNKVTLLGDYSFEGCSSLTKITIPNSVTSIGSHAFQSCSGLTSITIPNSVTKLGYEVFRFCDNLERVVVPGSVSEMEMDTFANCSGLKTAGPLGSNSNIEFGWTTKIPSYAFYGCGSLSSVTIPNSVTGIEGLAFSDCSSLTSITIPENVTYIGQGAFSDCANLTSITMPTSMDYIGSYAFRNCSSLTDIYFTGTREQWNKITLQDGNEQLQNATIHFNQSGSEISENISGVLTKGDGWELKWQCYGNGVGKKNDNNGQEDLTLEITLTGNPKKSELIIVSGSPWLNEEYGLHRKDFKKIIITGIAERFLQISSELFRDYTGITTLELEHITRIGSYVFQGCTSLEYVDGFDDHLVSVGDGAFKNCTNLKSVMSYQASNLETIGEEAFMNTSLKKLYLLENVNTIGKNVFSGCENELIIYCYPYTYACSYAVTNKVKYESLSEEEYSVFRMRKDSWSFPNFGFTLENYYISPSDFERLLSGCDDVQKKIIEYYQKQPGGGRCRGMAAAAVLIKMGLLSPDDFESGAKQTYDVSLKRGAKVESLIDYYFLAQHMYNNFADIREFQRLDTKAQLNRIESLAEAAMAGGAPFLLEAGVGMYNSGHAVVGYKVEHDTYIRNFKVYDSRILIYDVNNPKNTLRGLYNPILGSPLQDTALYYNQNTSEWYWPAHPSSDTLWQATNESTILAPAPKGEELKFYTVYSNTLDKYDLKIDGQDYWIVPNINTGEIIGVMVSDGDDSQNGSIVTIPADALEYVISPSDDASDFMIEMKDSLVTVNCDDIDAIEFHSDGSFTAENVNGDYNLSVLFNEGVNTTPWNETHIQGTGDGNNNISMVQIEEGIVIEGTEGMATVCVLDTSGGESSVSFRGEAEPVLVTAMQINGQEVPVVMADEDNDGSFEKLIAVGVTDLQIELDRDYIIMHPNETVTLDCSVNSEELKPNVKWHWETAEENNDELLLTVEDGKVTALTAGTAYVVASLEINGMILSDRCRVDVVKGENEAPIYEEVSELGVRLPNTKATVELFKTAYTKIYIEPVLSQNIAPNGLLGSQSNFIQSNVITQGNKDLRGIGAIETARFLNTEAAALFDLRPADDRTLEIIPKDSALLQGENAPKTIPGTFKTGIAVTIEGKEIIVKGTLTMTVKKSLPVVKAKSVKLNTAFSGDTQNLVFTGGNVTAIEPDASKANPTWLLLNEEKGTISYNGTVGAKQSGKMYLLLTIDGWAIKKSVTVSVNAIKTVPRISFRSANLTLLPAGRNYVQTGVVISPDVYKNEKLFSVGISRISEIVGRSEIPTEDALSCMLENGTLIVREGTTIDTSRAHTFKVYLAISAPTLDMDVVEKAITIKTKVAKAPTLNANVSGAIDLSVEESPVKIKITSKNFQTEQLTLSVADIVKTKTKESAADRFTIGVEGTTVTLRAGAGLEKGNYTVSVFAAYDESEPIMKKVNITVKESKPAKVPQTLSLKASGSIDVLRPDAVVTIAPVFKNCYTQVLSEEDISITKVYDGSTKKAVSENATDLFTVKLNREDGKYVILKKPGAALSHKDKFKVTATVTTASGRLTSKAIAMKVIQGKAKVNQSTQMLTLLKQDRFSEGEVKLALTDSSLSGIVHVELDKASAEMFDLTDLGNGKYVIGYKGNVITTTKAKTAKLRVFLEGNQTTIPNTILSVKVKIV